jgi:hypothetical protein
MNRESGGREARRWLRRAFVGKVFLEEQGGEEFPAVELSAGGIGIRCPRRLGPGRMVELAFLDRAVSVKGIVRHETPQQSEWRIGIEFLQPQPDLVDVVLAVTLQSG